MNQLKYTTPQETLNTISLNNHCMDYKLARKFIEIELALLQQRDHKWQEGVLSELPIVIYNYKKMPVYYEFRIYNNTAMLGALTITIIKEDGFPHIFELNSPQNLDDIIKQFPHFALIDCGYPTVGYCEDYGQDIWKIHSFDNSMEDIQVIDQDKELYQELKTIDKDMEWDQRKLNDWFIKDQVDWKSFWKYVDENSSNILNTEIKVDIKSTISSEKVTADLDPSWNWYVDYADSIYGWCGPALMTWFISVVGDIKDKSPLGIQKLYQEIEDIVGTGPVITHGLNKIFKNPKSPFAKLPYQVKSTPFLSFQTEKIMDYMKVYKMPIASLINFLTIGKGWGSWHWRGIFEIEKISCFDKYKSVFSWWNWKAESAKNQFQYIYTVFDNGYTLSTKPGYVEKYDIQSYKGTHYFKEQGAIPFVYFFPFIKK